MMNCSGSTESINFQEIGCKQKDGRLTVLFACGYCNFSPKQMPKSPCNPAGEPA